MAKERTRYLREDAPPKPIGRHEVYTTEGRGSVETRWTAGVWAVHKLAGPHSWVLDHLPTGRYLTEVRWSWLARILARIEEDEALRTLAADAAWGSSPEVFAGIVGAREAYPCLDVLRRPLDRPRDAETPPGRYLTEGVAWLEWKDRQII